MNKFAKLYESEPYGQILVMKYDIEEDGANTYIVRDITFDVISLEKIETMVKDYLGAKTSELH